jgi:1,4-alpha-glucan branching enzyme
METGYLSIVLHAHLPFVRRPDIADFLEERWLFEALSESYLPLLRSMRRMEEDGVPFRFTLSLSPTLQAMLADALLQERYLGWLERQLTFAGREAERLSGDPRRQALALMYAERYMADREDFEALYGRNILKGFDFFQKKGRLEIITTAGTHASFPSSPTIPRAWPPRSRRP